jgi:hypothetical protein
VEPMNDDRPARVVEYVKIEDEDERSEPSAWTYLASVLLAVVGVVAIGANWEGDPAGVFAGFVGLGIAIAVLGGWRVTE